MPALRAARCGFLTLGFSLALLGPISTAGAQEVVITEEARGHFQVGVNLLQDPDGARYEEAYQAFKRAYAASPSHKILGNLGLCAMKLERDGEAIEAFQKYLEQATDLGAEEKRQIEVDLRTLTSTTTSFSLTVRPADGEVELIDLRTPVKGAPITNRYGVTDGTLSIKIRPGQHRMTVRRAGYEDQSFDLAVPASGTLEKSVTLVEPREDAPAVSPPGSGAPSPAGPDALERPVPVSVWIGLAATGVFAVAAGITGAVALGKNSDFSDQNDGTDPVSAEDAKSSGQTFNLLTDVFIGGAVVAAGITAVLYFTRPEVDSRATGLVPLGNTAAIDLQVGAEGFVAPTVRGVF